jgi:hypothetical protein
MQGARGAFHLSVRQAILCRERFETVPYDVRHNKPVPCLTRGRMRVTPQMGVFHRPAKEFSE